MSAQHLKMKRYSIITGLYMDLHAANLDHIDQLRDNITKAYRMDENDCLNNLLNHIYVSETAQENIEEMAKIIIEHARAYKIKHAKIDLLLHQYNLTTEEGIALMCLAEALLRIPDKQTMDKFIYDKLSSVEWKNYLKSGQSFFINAATWSLLLTGKIYAPALSQQQNWLATLKRAVSRLGVGMIRPVILKMMKTLGKQFVLGEDIQTALQRARAFEAKGYNFSYDMLGEAARTAEDAHHYLELYLDAISAIGQEAKSDQVDLNPSISVKLSALHPRYEFSQRERVLTELPPLLLKLAQEAKKYNMGLNIDAEEADRLDLLLDIFAIVFKDPSLNAWEGFGLALQAYQKRAFFVIDWLRAMGVEQNKKIRVRLVKGAYWDAEIKQTQILGLSDYPVFTRKSGTDVSYLACVRKLFHNADYIYPQFGTHNVYSIASILEMVKEEQPFEFQCLHGMGTPIYDQVKLKTPSQRPTRIYAPVGTHRDLLGYLVRRLLENGANSSFVNQLSDESISIEKLISNPVASIAKLTHKSHPRIPHPQNIYGKWENSQGVDLSNFQVLKSFTKRMQDTADHPIEAASIVNGKLITIGESIPVYSPNDADNIVGRYVTINDASIDTAIDTAFNAFTDWQMRPVDERASILEKAAILLQQVLPECVALLALEEGKCLPDGIAEVREAIDYCRYYAYRARKDFTIKKLPGPTGEANQLSLHPRGVIACISPWNFPLAIFLGQITAALVAGNSVIAKPAEQTPLIAFKAIQLLHQAGIPKEVLQLVIGPGSVVGPRIINNQCVAGVMFTGSTETAKSIQLALAKREGPIIPLIAETGGQNAMIVDSSALAEQTVFDIAQSAFNSAGQRCSALRVLFLQEEIAPRITDMLIGYMKQLKIGNSFFLSTDVGPVIDSKAKKMLEAHFHRMQAEGKLLAQVPLPKHLNGNYFAPALFEIPNLSLLQREVFGPILHVIRYASSHLDKVMDAITQTGYGLTLGIHSRIESTVQYIASRMPVGNIYVNRNIIGAVVGVQPFGGEGLSGTGPKAGGPHYIPRLCVERAISNNITAVGGNARLISLLEED